VSFSTDGRVLAVAGSITAIRLWEVGTWAEKDTLEVGGLAKRVAFSRDGTMLAVDELDEDAETSRVTIWDLASRRRLFVSDGFIGGVNDLAFSPNGSLLVVGDNTGLVRLWDLAARRSPIIFPAARRGQGGVISLAFSPKGDLLATAAAFESTAKIWDASSGEPRGSLAVPDSSVKSLAFSPDGTTLVMAQWDGRITLRDVNRGREVAASQAQGKPLLVVAISDDGRTIATGGLDGTVRLWDASLLRQHASP
jgi:WD40 repeat protein